MTAIGTPPPLPLQPLVDEVLRALEARQREVVNQPVEHADRPLAELLHPRPPRRISPCVLAVERRR